MSRNINNPCGFKINFKGKIGINQVIRDIAANLLNLRNEFKIEELSGVNFYCQIYKNDESQSLLKRETGEQISGIVIKANKNHKKIESINDGTKKITYEALLSPEELAKEIEERTSSFFLKKETYHLLSKSEIEDRIEELEKERILLIQAQKEKEKKEQKARLEREEKEKLILNRFRDQIKLDFDISEEEFKYKVSSFSRLVSESTIKKYLEQNVVPKGYYYRVTLTNENTGRAGDIYLYNSEYKQIKHIKREQIKGG